MFQTKNYLSQPDPRRRPRLEILSPPVQSAEFSDQRIEIQVSEDSNSQGLPQQLRKSCRRLVQPDFAFSCVFHSLLLVLLAVLLMPSELRESIEVTGRQTEKLKIDPITIESIEFTSSVLDFDEPIPDQTEIESNFESLPELTFNSARTELDSGLALDTTFSEAGVDSRESLENGQGSLSPEAKKIQTRVERAGGESGEVQFSLIWENESDVDLHVITPDSHHIYYDDRTSRCRGVLDVDRNAKSRNLTTTPVENVRWKQGAARTGRYTVLVHLFNSRGNQAFPFELMHKLGDDVGIENSQFTFNSNLAVFRYVFFDNDVPESERPQRLEELKQLQEREEAAAQNLFKRITNPARQERDLWRLINTYPHTDTSIEALKLIRGSGQK
jgi:hypothetical protein